MYAPLVRRRSSLRILLALSLTVTLLLLPNAPVLMQSDASLIQQGRSEGHRMGNPKRGKPEATLPNLETVRNETQVTREIPAPIPSTMRSKKIPLQAWDGRRVGEEHLPARNVNPEEPRGGEGKVASAKKYRNSRQTKRAHAERLRPSAPTPVLDDTFIDNFYTYALPGYSPLSNEKPHWRDQLRVGYAQSQTSLQLAAREMGRTLFESATYAARGQDDHGYVWDLYRTYLMRDATYDQSGWNFWTSMVSSTGRENVRRSFEECDEFGVKMSEIVPNGSASGNQTSLISTRVDPRNQPGNGLLTRDATWSLPLLSLPGRAGLDLGLVLSYSSLVWTPSGPFLYFDEDTGFPSPGFRLGFPTVQRKTFAAQVARNTYLLLTPGGHRVELRQVGTSNIYEAADSSYLQLTDNGSSLLVRSTDGTQMTYVETNGEYRCTQIKDRNGNYITINYNTLGRITTITDTLTRVITFNYDGNHNLLSITQAGKTDAWVTFGWTNKALGLSFSNVALIGTTATAQLPVINQVAVNDGSYFQFDYSNSLQVSTITRKSCDNVQRAQTSFTYQSPGSDAPRLTASSVSASNWTGINGVPSLVTTNYSVNGNTYSLTAPDGTVYSETYGTGWKKGLVTGTEILSGGVVQKWTTTSWTQDDTSLPISWEINPRVTETNVYDESGNRRRTAIDYHSQFGLPHVIAEYAADATNVLRYTILDYKNESTYIDRRIIGLVFRHTILDGSWNLQAKTEYGYDWDWNGDMFQDTPAAATQHDRTNYGASFIVGRGNLSQQARFDITDPNNTNNTIVETKWRVNSTGSVLMERDHLWRQKFIVYGDSFSDGVNRNTFAYPTTMTDADGFSSYVKYHFGLGATTRTEGPAPAGQSQGAIQDMVYNSKWQLERITTVNTGAYQRFEYGPDFTKSFSTVNTTNDEAYSLQTFDGLGRTISSGSNHPGSTGGYKAQTTIYDHMGRAIKVSNPAETNGAWNPVGDDAAGWLFTQQTYNWQGKPLITTNPDGTTKEVSYSGCGCAGGEVVTLTDEGTLDVSSVAKRRQQKIYSDVLGRTKKTEVLNWQGGTVYSATVNTYDALDRVILVRQYAGVEGSGTFQDTVMTYDGHGRLKTWHEPEQNTGTNTVWNYNADDTVNTITDSRGVVTTFGYNARHLITSRSYNAPSGITPTATTTYGYDAAGNRTLMTDGLGSKSYSYDQLSRLSSETRTLTGLGSYGMTYQYNLANQLKSITDPTNPNARIDYSFSNAGEVKTVTGVNYSTASFISDVKYRAWGAPKQISYGNGRNLSVIYNGRLQPNHLEIGGANLPLVMSVDYERYDDGSVRYSEDLTDSRFDRAFKYDHSARLIRGLSGAEARGEPATGDRPYNEMFGYDAFNHLTNRTTRHWSKQAPYISVDAYVNNKRTGWGYDAAGNLTSAATHQYTNDAAGRLVFSATANMAQFYDGDGLRIKTTEANVPTFYLTSTVLGGKVVAELDNAGVKRLGLIYQGTEVLAEQYQDGSIALLHKDVSNLSVRKVDAQTGVKNDATELDPMEANTELADPYPLDPGYDGRGEGGPLYPNYGNIVNPSLGCLLGGNYPCDRAFAQALETAKFYGSVDLATMSARIHWIPEDTSYGVEHLGGTQDSSVDIFLGPGGHFVVTQSPSQAPVIESIHWWELSKIRTDVIKMGQSGRCQEFLTKLLERAGQTGGEKPVHTNIGDLFDAVLLQQGFVTQREKLGGRGFSSVRGAVGAPGGAEVRLSADTYDYKGKLRTQYFAYDALSELTHVAGSKPSGYATGAFSDYHLAKTALEVANEMGGFRSKLKLPKVDPNTDSFGAWSDNYHFTVSLFCRRENQP